MRRYRVEVTRPAVYFVDADTPENAANTAIALTEGGMRPAYYVASSASVDVVAEVLTISERRACTALKFSIEKAEGRS